MCYYDFVFSIAPWASQRSEIVFKACWMMAWSIQSLLHDKAKTVSMKIALHEITIIVNYLRMKYPVEIY